MPTRLLLEGADLAELMVHVRAEFGPTARVVRAERVRTGGVAGFFARERYELTIDVPDESSSPQPTLLRRRLGPGGVVQGGPGSGAGTSAAGGPVGIEGLLAAADAGDDGPPGSDVLAPGAPGGPGTVATPGPRVSTGEEAFASVLERMRQLTGGIGEDHQIEVPAPAGATAAAPGVPEADARIFEPLAAPAVAAAPAVPVAPAPPAAPPAGGVPRADLEDLGLPAALLDAVGPGPVELSRLLAHVPSAPPVPREPGTVLVVVGPPEDAVRTADLLALRSGTGSPSTVVHAGDIEPTTGHGRRLTTPQTAERWRARSGEVDELTVVALGVRPGRTREAAGAELLAALAPDQVWAAVDARSKVRDCVRWLGAVGSLRPIDALAVTGLFDTSEPGTVLGLGIPVAWIDGVPASRVAWAAALGEHLPDGTIWG